MPCKEIQQALEKEKQNASKLVAMKSFIEELLNVAEEQHQQLGTCAQSISTNSESEAQEYKVIRPKPTAASTEMANISCQHAALLRKAVFDTVPGTINVR